MIRNKRNNEWPIGVSHYQILGLVGSGSYANVYKAKCVDNGKIVAVRMLNMESSSIDFDGVRHEIEILRMCDEPHILPFYCCFCVDHFLWIITPFMEKGSLLRILGLVRSNMDSSLILGFSESVTSFLVREVLLALSYIHNSSLLHLDVKAGNILVNSTGSICLSDFGIIPTNKSKTKTTTATATKPSSKPSSKSSSKSSKQSSQHNFVGTPCWMAPEIISESAYASPADIWSLGITALELYKGFPPLARFDSMEIYARIANGDPPSFDSYTDAFPSHPSSSFKSFIKSVLRKSPEERGNADDLLNHSWFKQAEEGRKEFMSLIENIPDIEENTSCELVFKSEKCADSVVWDFSCLDRVSASEGNANNCDDLNSSAKENSTS